MLHPFLLFYKEALVIRVSGFVLVLVCFLAGLFLAECFKSAGLLVQPLKLSCAEGHGTKTQTPHFW